MYKALIFDMNGVIVNDERIHQASWRQLCKKYGFELSEEQFKQFVFGRTEKDTLNYLFDKELTEAELAPYLAERVEIAIELYKPDIALTDGLATFLKDLAAHHVPLAIATSARWPYTNFVLDTLSIRPHFKSVVTAEDIQNGKPHPEIYLKAAAQLGIAPEECIAIEDSVSGIKSAKTAQMYVVGITTTHLASELKQADRVIETFNDLTPQNLGLV
jgi:beta-phosphoglucomutase-like phosphatase (HAD superfamily)